METSWLVPKQSDIRLSAVAEAIAEGVRESSFFSHAMELHSEFPHCDQCVSDNPCEDDNDCRTTERVYRAIELERAYTALAVLRQVDDIADRSGWRTDVEDGKEVTRYAFDLLPSAITSLFLKRCGFGDDIAVRCGVTAETPFGAY